MGSAWTEEALRRRAWEQPEHFRCVVTPEEAAGMAASVAAPTSARSVAERMAAAGVPEAFRSVPADPRHVDAMRRGLGLWFVGPVGCGKTTAACSVLRGWVEAGGRARFARCGTLQDELDDARRRSDAVAALSSVPLLVLDDLGKEVPTARALSRLFAVVDGRWSRNLPTVVTSQLSGDALALHLSQWDGGETARSILSRMVGSMRVVQPGREDRRRAGRRS